MESYFQKTPDDISYYNEFIRDRLPSTIADAHLHLTRHEYNLHSECDPNSWASQCAHEMPFEDYEAYSKAFYPDATVYINALPSVRKGVDIDGANGYISRLKKEGKARWCHMLVDPSWSAEDTERRLIEGNFDGYKPYPDFVSGARGSEIGLFDFVRHDQLALLDKYKKSMVLHLPRAGRYPDDNNVKEVLTVLDKYPDLKLVIAHCGRCYAYDYIKEAKEKLGEAFSKIHYDLAAVLNPQVLDFMLENVPDTNLFYATDLPVFLWHGKRRWTAREYYNLAREDFPWNPHEEGCDAESKYVFFLYVQLKNILDSAYAHGGRETAEKLFFKNAFNYY